MLLSRRYLIPGGSCKERYKMLKLNRRIPRALKLGLLTCSSVLVFSMTGCGSGTEAPVLERPQVSAELSIPQDFELSLIADGVGVQIYECTDTNGTLGWTLRAPRADLLVNGEKVGNHFGGVDKAGFDPGAYWQSVDDENCWVRANANTIVKEANPGSIPLLRLEAAAVSGNCTFSDVAFIQRLETTGGVAPTEACALGDKKEIDYTAEYYFYTTP
ncbi:MAG TPA: hypothetical protein DF383_01270 [Deltaproteobacteria bacterium]|nr:hypothetical protein [Deltaproteobacteria bacterium]